MVVAKDVCDGEGVGLHSSTYGRSCDRNASCRHKLEVGSIVRFKQDVIAVGRDYLGLEGIDDAPNQVAEVVVKVIVVEGGQETCTVGFLPRYIALRPEEVNRFHGQFAQIIELYDKLEAGMSYKRTRSAMNNGMASFVLLNDVPLLVE